LVAASASPTSAVCSSLCGGPFASTPSQACSGYPCFDYPLCFSEETLVATPTGAVPIAQIEPGDWVLSYDHETQQVEPNRVLRKIENLDPVLLELSLDDGTKLRVTAEHPLYDTTSDTYIPAGKLGPAEALLRLELGESTHVYAAQLRLIGPTPAISGQRAYDLTVEDNHNFFAAGVLAHNKSQPFPYPSVSPEFPNAPPTCDFGPLEVHACHEQGQWDSTQRPAVGAAAPFVAVSTPLSAAAVSALASWDLATLPDAGAGEVVARDAGSRSTAVLPVPSASTPSDAGHADAAVPSDASALGENGGVPSGKQDAAAIGVEGDIANSTRDASVLGSDGGVVSSTRDASTSSVDGSVPLAPWGVFDGGVDVGVLPDPPTASESADDHALWLEFRRCPHQASLVAYSAKLELNGGAGEYSFGVFTSDGTCALPSESMSERLVVESSGSATAWLTLPESGAPYWLVIRGPETFEASLELY
jgi:hypothetical protein